MRSSRALTTARAAVVAYTGVFIAGSALSIRRGYPAHALGIDLGDDVRRGVYGGIEGAGLAAPANLVVQMWVAAALAGRPSHGGRRAKAWLAFLSAMFLAGQVSEPVSHKITTRELPTLDSAVVLANIVLPIVMLVGALAALTKEGVR